MYSFVVRVLNHCTTYGRGEPVCSPGSSREPLYSPCDAAKSVSCSGQTHRSAPTFIITPWKWLGMTADSSHLISGNLFCNSWYHLQPFFRRRLKSYFHQQCDRRDIVFPACRLSRNDHRLVNNHIPAAGLISPVNACINGHFMEPIYLLVGNCLSSHGIKKYNSRFGMSR